MLVMIELNLQNELQYLVDHWQLSNVRPMRHESVTNNYVACAYSQQHHDVVIKIGCKKVIDAEIEALQMFQGDACVKLLQFDQKFSQNYSALMLEHVQPGNSLKDSFLQGREDKSIEIFVDLVQRLHKNSDQKIQENFQTVEQRVQFLHTFRPRSEELLEILPQVQQVADRLVNAQGIEYLLHGDLHHENIIQKGTDWVMIDPQGVIGELAYEVGAYIRNPIFSLSEQTNVEVLLWYRFEKLHQLLNIDQQRIIDWSLVQTVLAACYAEQDGDEKAQKYFIDIAHIIIKITDPDYKLDISVVTVQSLVQQQFPELANLSIEPVACGGWDNKTFHLGDSMSIRMPSSKEYAHQVAKEQKWIPFLASHLSIQIAQPIAMGKPFPDYPFCWSVYRWLDGQSANILGDDQLDYVVIAQQLAQFLYELHQIDATGGPVTDRGGSPVFYNDEALAAIAKLEGVIDTVAAKAVWSKAIASRWQKPPVWAHGDLSSGNILVQNRQLSAVIDFGSITIGDPACDLVIAWTFLHGESRQIFKKLMNLDEDTWARAAGWALWKAMITLVAMEDRTTLQARKQRQIINDIVQEYGG